MEAGLTTAPRRARRHRWRIALGRTVPHLVVMAEVLIILEPNLAPADRSAVVGLAPVRQSISERVFVADPAAPLQQLRAARGVEAVLVGPDDRAALPALDDAETLFAEAWLSAQGASKRRIGEGLDWDTPPMTPPDPKR